jgi:uncharacterized protein with ParB-like and HNH nuclease domain
MARVFKRPEVPQLLSVAELFSRDVILNIPKWQREYSWDADEEVRELLEDLEAFVSSNKFNYVLGSIITYTQSDGSHAVVDGQQRTVTLYTMLVAARDLLEFRLMSENGAVSDSPDGFRALYQSLDSLTRKVSLDLEAKISIPIFMEYGEGNQLLTALAIKTPRPTGIMTVSQTNILNAYEKCKEFLEKTCPTAALLGEYVRGVMNGTFLVETNVGDQRQALDIFFKMNSRGRDLEGADYLKNYMFQALLDDQYDELSEKWAEMSKALRSADSSRSKLKTPEFFLRNLAIVEKGEKINGEQGVFDYWESRFKLDSNEVEKFLSIIGDKAGIFSKIAGNKLIKSKEQNQSMVAADYFKGTQYLPVLLAGSHLEEYEHLSELVNYRYLIYILGQERTQDFESMVPRWAKAISKLPSNSATNVIDDATSEVIGLSLDPVRLAALEARLADLATPKDERKIRLVLATVSLGFEDGLSDLSEFLKKYRPNKHSGFDFDLILNTDEISKLGINSQSMEYREYLGIGNSALVNGQSKHFANKPPASKEDLYGNDKGVLTRALSASPGAGDKVLNDISKEIRKELPVSLYEWDLEQIRNRRAFILDQFIGAIPDCLIL